jgi:hypothetical protein
MALDVSGPAVQGKSEKDKRLSSRRYGSLGVAWRWEVTSFFVSRGGGWPKGWGGSIEVLEGEVEVPERKMSGPKAKSKKMIGQAMGFCNGQ